MRTLCTLIATAVLAFCQHCLALLLVGGILCTALLCGCKSLEDKNVIIGNQVSAMKVETVGTSSGTPLPNLIIGSAQTALVTSHAYADSEKAAPSVHINYRSSFLGELFGIKSNDVTVSYIGGISEKGSETKAAFDGIARSILAAGGITGADTVPVVVIFKDGRSPMIDSPVIGE